MPLFQVELENAFEEGIWVFDASCVRGFCPYELNPICLPILKLQRSRSYRGVPERNAVARMFCSIKTPEGEYFDGDSRYVLKRQVAKAAKLGYVLNVGPELEYFYFKDSTNTDTLDQGGYFDLTSLDMASDLRRDTILTLEKMGIPVEYSHHESGPSQQEIDLRFADALTMADNVMTYKLVVKEIAAKYGVYASFMPKPLTDAPGSGMHIHQSLFDSKGNNAFFDSNDPDGFNLSELAKHYIAGLLKYAPEYCLLTNPCVNSYKRLVPGGEAPVHITWARNNRSALVRIPGYKPHKEEACRVELRCPDPSANPYLAFSAVLAAGLKGIEEKLPLQDSIEDSDWSHLSRQELHAQGIETLPDTLGEAVERFARSELMKEVLGDHIHSFLVDAKRKEWNEYLRQVSNWELDVIWRIVKGREHYAAKKKVVFIADRSRQCA